MKKIFKQIFRKIKLYKWEILELIIFILCLFFFSTLAYVYVY